MCGYFVFDESIYILLDIGFIWQIYLDTEMGLLPCSVAIQELPVSGEFKQQLRRDSELLLAQGSTAEGVERMIGVPVKCVIKEVTVFASDDGDKLRLYLNGEDSELSVECSLVNREIVLRAN